MKKYYEAYDQRYATIHQENKRWTSLEHTKILDSIINKYNINKDNKLLELGCGEGRDSIYLLQNGFNLLATDVSRSAIQYCKENYPRYQNHFVKLDFLQDKLNDKYDFIYLIAVLHMLVLDEDRNGLYQFIFNHLEDNGICLITSMGDGIREYSSDINQAFEMVKRNHNRGEIMVPATSCRMVNMKHFLNEITSNNFQILESGVTEAYPEFDSLLYAVIKKK